MTERSDSPGKPVGVRLSRRTFVLAGGSLVGAVTGTASASDDSDRRDVNPERDPITVAATEPYRQRVEAAIQHTDADAYELTVDTPIEDPDVFVAGRPIDRDGSHAEVRIDAWSTLTQSDGEWHDPLRPSTVRELWRGDAPVELWWESGQQSVPDWDDEGALDHRSPARRRSRSSAVPSRLVYGTRSYQYANGHGGAGYYTVATDAIRDATTDGLDGNSSGTGGQSTLIARLGYVHVSSRVRSDDRISALRTLYGHALNDPPTVTMIHSQ